MGCPFFGLLFLTPGIHALRPSGQLRCSHTLLRVRGHAKKSDSGLGRGTKRPPRRRATWRQRINETRSHWMTSFAAVKRLQPSLE
jgi:hypothetical protein